MTEPGAVAHDVVVSSTLGTVDAPPALRARRPTWRDPRLWTGIAVLAASVLLGARVLAAADDTTRVWAAAGPLQAGDRVDTGDLVATPVRLSEAELGRYLSVDAALPPTPMLVRAVGAGELVPASAFGDPGTGLVEVPVWAPTVAVPTSVRAGAIVDVWVLPEAGSARSAGARLALDDVAVVAARRGDGSFGPGSSRQVLVGVPDGTAGIGAVLAAARDNRVAITRQG